MVIAGEGSRHMADFQGNGSCVVVDHQAPGRPGPRTRISDSMAPVHRWTRGPGRVAIRERDPLP